MGQSADNWIFGAGSSGQAAAALLQSQGESFRILDQSGGGELPDDVPGRVIVSPGFPCDHPWLIACRSQGAELLSEAEFGLRHLKGSTLTVTGSLGKTSMVELATLVLRGAGSTVTLSGNVGVPVCEIAVKQPVADVHVVELSSFQLELFTKFEPDVGVLLNLLPNHLDRHGSMQAYERAKLRLFRGAGVAVIPSGILLSDFNGEIRHHGVEDGWKWKPGSILKAGTSWMDFDEPAFNQPGVGANLAALCAALEALGVDSGQMASGMDAFRFPPHRREDVTVRAPWRVVNDSKSTCLAATLSALEACAASISGSVHLLVGGRGKEEDLEKVIPGLEAYRPSVYLMGESAAGMKKVWTGSVPYCENNENLSDCLRAAWQRCQSGDAILLSPGCASFDQFKNFEDRGQQFRELVEVLDAGGGDVV